MNFLAFFASIVSSLAWPCVMALFLFFIRKRVGVLIDALAARIIKARLPGGFEIEFGEKLSEARKESEILAIEGKAEVKPSTFLASEDEERYLKLAQVSGPAAIMEAFKEVENVVVNNRRLLGDLHERPLPLVALVTELKGWNVIDAEVLEQFYRVQRLRNLAVHEAPQITVPEAIEYRNVCKSLVSAFNMAFARLQAVQQPSATDNF